MGLACRRRLQPGSGRPAMIAKQTRGNRMRGLVLYLFGPGRHEEHRDPRIISAWKPVIGDGRLTRKELENLVDDLDAPRRFHGTEVTGGYVWQCSLRNPDEDRLLSDAEWGRIAEETIARLGFADGCRWVAVRHADNHIHLAVNLVRKDGGIAGVWNDRRKLSAACADFERRYGLIVRALRDGAGMPGLARAEIERTRRDGQPEPARHAIARKIRAAAAGARDEADFVRRARTAGLRLRPRWAAGGRRHVVGYSVALPGGKSRPMIWFGGGRLAADLTLPQLRRRWPGLDPQSAAEAWQQATTIRPAATAPRLRQEAWTEAGRVVDQARRRLASVPAEDAVGWAAAAIDAAGALAALAARAEKGRPGQLSRAADELARSARLPRPDRRATALNPGLAGMAGVARAAADALIVAQGGHAAVAVLLTQLSRLIRDIQKAHAAAGRAEQARRAAQSADELRRWLQRPAPAAPEPAVRAVSDRWRPSAAPSADRGRG